MSECSRCRSEGCGRGLSPESCCRAPPKARGGLQASPEAAGRSRGRQAIGVRCLETTRPSRLHATRERLRAAEGPANDGTRHAPRRDPRATPPAHAQGDRARVAHGDCNCGRLANSSSVRSGPVKPRGALWTRAARDTERALARGADVVYQAALVSGEGWRGMADFVLRQPDGSYEVVDTKLARHAKP